MFRSFRLGSVLGIPVVMHAALPAILLLVAAIYNMGQGFPGFLLTFFWLVLAVGCLFLHELGHAVAARLHGISVLRIQLLPIVSGAEILARRLNPPVELRIALAGPLVNLALAGVLVLAHSVWERPELQYLWILNLGLALLNLLPGFLPGFPMDGGRILRAILAWKGDDVRASFVAGQVGQLTALGVGLGGLLIPDLLLAFVVCVWAVFLFLGARTEMVAASLGSAIDSLREEFEDFEGGPPSATRDAESSGEDGIRGPVQPGENPEDCIIDVDPEGKVRRILRHRDDRPGSPGE